MNRREFLRASAASAGYAVLASTVGCATTSSPRDESVIVIGAGMAGIATGRALQESGYRVTVLEAQGRNGGRIMTDRSSGTPVDLGAAWIHGKRRNPITALARQYGAQYAETDWDNVQGYQNGEVLAAKKVSDAHDQLSSIYRKTYWKEAIEHSDGLIDDIMAQAKRRSNISEESISEPEDYLISSEKREIRALRESALQVDREYREYGGGEQLVIGGYDTIISGLAEGLSILNRQVVEKIQYTASGVKVTTNRTDFTADRVVITIPLGVLKQKSIVFEPGLSPEKEAALDRLGMTTLNKIILHFPKAFWSRAPHGLIQLKANNAPRLFLNLHHYHDEPILAYLASSTHAREIEALSNEDSFAFATDILKDMFGSRIPEPTAALRTRWASNAFSQGSFSYRKAGSSPADRDALAEAVDGRIFFAGEATHARRYGTVHGAYLSGLRAAEEVVRA